MNWGLLWTAEEGAKAQAMHRAGHKCRAIAATLPGRSEDGVRGWLKKRGATFTRRVQAPEPPASQWNPDEAEILRLARRGLGVTRIGAQLRVPYREVVRVMDGAPR